MKPVFRRAKQTAPAGFTLVELLIVISIIGVLVALLMPAINSARESGRRAQCSNNLHQLALACLAHESKNTFLPTGGWGWCWVGDPDRGYGKNQPGGWQYNILPFIDQSDLHDLGTGSNGQWGGGPSSWPAGAMGQNATKRSQTPLAIFNCPSRRKLKTLRYTGIPGLSVPFNNPTQPTTGALAVAAHSDYAANAGDHSPALDFASGSLHWLDGISKYSDGDSFPETGPQTPPNQPPTSWEWEPGGAGYSTGPIYLHSQSSMAAIKVGTSYCYLIGERFVATEFYNGGSGCDDDQSWDIGFDYDVQRWATNPPLQDYNVGKPPGDCAENFGSAHPAGFHMAFCDGSVRKMNYSIDPVLHQQLANCLGNGPNGPLTQLQKLDDASRN